MPSARLFGLLVRTEATTLEGRFETDPEGGAFVACSQDRAALDDLAGRLRTVAADGSRLRDLVEFAESSEFEFDDRTVSMTDTTRAVIGYERVCRRQTRSLTNRCARSAAEQDVQPAPERRPT